MNNPFTSVHYLPVTVTASDTVQPPVSVVVDSVGATAETCHGEKLVSFSLTIPDVPGVPNDLAKQSLCVALQDPRVVDEKLVQRMVSLPASAHPDHTRAQDLIENEARLEKEAIKTSNLLKLACALGDVFGFAGYQNSAHWAKRKVTDPIWIGLSGAHDNVMPSSQTIEGPPLSEQGDFPVLTEFVNALHQLTQRKKLRDYLPEGTKFWMLMESVENNYLVTPDPRDGTRFLDYLDLHPEVHDLLRTGRLEARSLSRSNNLAAPSIGVLGSEPMSREQLNDALETLAANNAQAKPTSTVHSFKDVAEFCRTALKELRNIQCNRPVIEDRDRRLIGHTTKLMEDLYGEAKKKWTGSSACICFTRQGSLDRFAWHTYRIGAGLYPGPKHGLAFNGFPWPKTAARSKHACVLPNAMLPKEKLS